ncbi:MAG: low molecular weight phosphotyrosine protein phosphatase [Hyphomicrobiales bacterium]|nr:low molecular weight phosphotyrosine protein phosphatase [Hyphomicrobiales bacterium]
MSSILFICLGNICRSPLAEGVFRNEAQKRGVADQLTIDSAGTGGWHIGNPPDQRSIETAANHDINISHQVCRRLTSRDFNTFDLILGMDNSNIINATSANRANGPAQLLLFTQFAGMRDDLEIADPYYSGVEGFETAYQLIKQASRSTLDRLFAD